MLIVEAFGANECKELKTVFFELSTDWDNFFRYCKT
jgi:hypothetical protein